MTSPAFRALDLTGRVAVVTGGARGIGRACVELLQARGARVVVSDLNSSVREQESDTVATMVGDASDETIARDTVALAVERFGGLDILVNNAVLPGVIDTDIMEGVVENGREMLAGFGSAHPIGRADEIAEAVGYLASDAAIFVTGALLAVDGSWSAQ